MKTKEKFSKYTIQSRSDLKKILIKEKKKYMEYIYPSVKKYLSGAFKSESIIKIMHWQQISRITDYHDYMFHVTGSKLYLIKYLWYIRI